MPEDQKTHSPAALSLLPDLASGGLGHQTDGRLVGAILGLVLLIVGIVVSLTIVGAVVGVPWPSLASC